MKKLNQKGSLIVMITLAFALLGTFIGFALDFGRAYLEKARVSRLIDGAALAAAKALKGQVGFENAATRAACDSMLMNGAKVTMSSPTTCSTVEGAPIEARISFFPAAVAGGPPLQHVRVEGTERVPTTFLRFLGWMAPNSATTTDCWGNNVPGNYSTISVCARAEAGPERPVDLVLVLDRSWSMSLIPPKSPGTKLSMLKTAVNEFLESNFTGNDRIGMVSFSNRGCGNTSGGDSTVTDCVADVPMTDATSSNITMLQNRVNGLDLSLYTNTQEALRTARTTIAPIFGDLTRVATRKAVLLVTDGKPTMLRIDTQAKCRQDPQGNPLPAPNNTNGSFPFGCLQLASDDNGSAMGRLTLSGSNSPGTINGATLFQRVVSCTRSLSLCNSGTNGAMYEADVLRNCGAGNASCGTGGEHDVVVFAIGIGAVNLSTPNASFDRNARCLLARIANATDIVNTGLGTIDSINTVCANPPDVLTDQDTYAELQDTWPSCTGPCINTAQEKGKVYVIDMNQDVPTQLKQVFAEIAAILKLRLTL